MSIISTSLIKGNLDFAIGNLTATLTAVTPTNTATYVCNKQDISIAYEIDENGREVTLDTRFYLAIDDYTETPSKGWILTDGTNNYKVMNTHKDAAGVTLRLECAEQHQR